MVRRDGAEVRKERIQKIIKFVMSKLNKNKGEIPLSKTLALLKYEYGLRIEKLMEYLEIGEEIERVLLCCLINNVSFHFLS